MFGRALRFKLRTFPVVLIVGPRQCGKTTFARGELGGWRLFDLEFSALKAEVAKILTGGGSMADRIIALVTAFAGHGVPIEGRFTFGAFKGLMTLYGEAYAPEEGFRRLLAGEIARVLKAKFPVTAVDARR